MRHGPGRGPHIRLAALRPAVYQPLLDDFAIRYPDLRQSIDVWETGSPKPDLSPYAAIVFVLSDPLKELYPTCYAEAEELAQQARHLGAHIVNAPAALSNTVKSTQARLLEAAGVLTARHLRYQSLDDFRIAVNSADFPAIVRADLLHAQSRMFFCETREQALRIPPHKMAFPGCIAEFVDTRAGYREVAPDSPYAAYFHKKRSFVFGNEVVNNHIFFGPHPIVGAKTSTFGHYRSLNPIRRWRANARCQQHVELDYQFFRREPEEKEMLLRAARALDLEFIAFDYSVRADGNIVIWEGNPHFSLYLWPMEILPVQRKIKERHRRFHDVIYTFFRDLQQGVS